MKIVFMGTPEFAVPALERLAASAHEVVLVVTQPDRPKGRGKKLEAPAVKVAAERLGIPVLQPASVRKEPIAAAIRDSGAQVVAVAAFGQILPDDVLKATKFGCLNIHPSMLPAYRGAAPLQRAILDGNSDTGVSIMQLVRELDAGPVIAQQPFELLIDDDARSVGDMAAVLGADMLLRVIDEAEKNGVIEAEPQDDKQATYAPPIKKEEGLIPWKDSSEAIMCRLRAFTPWPGVFTYVNGERLLIIKQAEPAWPTLAEELAEYEIAKPGAVVAVRRDVKDMPGFVVRTGSGFLYVSEVQPQGKGVMSAIAFVNGRGVAMADVLGKAKA